MNNILRIGLIGLGITLVVNLLGIFVFKTPAAEFFADEWWSTWFPSLLVWLVFTIVGVGVKISGKGKSESL